MRKYGTTLACFLILLVATIIVACAKPYHEETERYVLVTTNINLPYWQEAQAGLAGRRAAPGGNLPFGGATGDFPGGD